MATLPVGAANTSPKSPTQWMKGLVSRYLGAMLVLDGFWLIGSGF
jgi:hypothetical protein